NQTLETPLGGGRPFLPAVTGVIWTTVSHRPGRSAHARRCENGLRIGIRRPLSAVREGGLEPPRPISWALAPQASASTNSATRAGNRDNSTCEIRWRKIEIGICDAPHSGDHSPRCDTCVSTCGLPVLRSKTAELAAS